MVKPPTFIPLFEFSLSGQCRGHLNWGSEKAIAQSPLKTRNTCGQDARPGNPSGLNSFPGFQAHHFRTSHAYPHHQLGSAMLWLALADAVSFHCSSHDLGNNPQVVMLSGPRIETFSARNTPTEPHQKIGHHPHAFKLPRHLYKLDLVLKHPPCHDFKDMMRLSLSFCFLFSPLSHQTPPNSDLIAVERGIC